MYAVLYCMIHTDISKSENITVLMHIQIFVKWFKIFPFSIYHLNLFSKLSFSFSGYIFCFG